MPKDRKGTSDPEFADDPAELRDAVERLHGGKAAYVQQVPVIEEFNGERVWAGIVHVFDLAENDKATLAYAWSAPIDGSSKRKFYAVLHVPPIDSPQKAVRVAIVSDHKARTP